MLARWQVVSARWWLQTSEIGMRAVAHARMKLPMCVSTGLPLRRRGQLGFGNRVRGQVVDRLAGELAAIDEELAVLALEQDAVLEAQVVGRRG